MNQQNREGYDQTRDPRTGRPPLPKDAERMKAEKANQPEDGASDPGMSLEKEGEFEDSANARDALEEDLQSGDGDSAESHQDSSQEDAASPGRKEHSDASQDSLNADHEPPFPDPDIDGRRSGP